MDTTIAAWENEGGASQSVVRKVARRFAGHRTFQKTFSELSRVGSVFCSASVQLELP
jgi:hypothetical protein